MTAQGSFWARRRAAVQAEAQAQAQAEAEQLAAARDAELAEKDDALVLEEMGLPDPDQMQSGDDFAAFMSEEVPKHLRNKALRMLWRSNPVLACVDGLNEYDDDYRAAMLAGGPIQTAYQVGKGMMAHLEEVARQEELAKATPETSEEPVAEIVEDDPVSASEPEVVASEAQPENLALDAEGDVEAAPVPRRMRFQFEEAQA
ncbi:DUF3306 domain-containing protein [uncultured Roseobacter sp.]|uniref:DUF3306 domain-containing protein n=1 Tax=uncultured Roseobacter sp. TaxID=114847 RepID=UPI0026255605|nr:DUF3306 domain-containing protein [uncultured Roseobacter sp.]